MLERMSRDWWIVALQGVASIVFGTLAVIWPGLTLLMLIYLFGAYAIVDGVLALIRGFRRSGDHARPDWWRVARGVVGVAAGIVAFAMPDLTAFALLLVIASWAIASGVLGVVAAYRLRDEIQGEWLLALEGVVAIIFGMVLIVWPGAGALALVWLIASFAIASGVILIITAFRLRGRARDAGVPAPSLAPHS